MPKSVSTFREMRPEDVRKAIEGQPDVLGPALEAHRQYFSTLYCYRCGGEVYGFVNPGQLFRSGSVLPNYLAKCKVCGTEFEAYMKIEVKGPDAPRGP